MKNLPAILIVLSGVPMACAQVQVELQPFAGFKFGGSLRPGGDDPSLPQIDIRSSRVQGVSATVTGVKDRMVAGGEFMWNSQATEAIPSDGATLANSSLRIDQFLIHGLIGKADRERKLQPLPFALFGAGVTRMRGFTTFHTRYAYSFGGGVRCFFTKRLGLRIEGRFSPVHLYDTNQTYTVVNEPGTAPGTVRNLPKYFNQGEFTLGLIFRLF